jgi:hypothetical protein
VAKRLLYCGGVMAELVGVTELSCNEFMPCLKSILLFLLVVRSIKEMAFWSGMSCHEARPLRENAVHAEGD